VTVAEREKKEEGVQSGVMWCGVDVVCSTCFYENLHYQIHAHRCLLVKRAGHLQIERKRGRWEIKCM
jgi:hypothetical protein